MKEIFCIYEVDSANLSAWRTFGIKHEKIVTNKDMGDIARAILLLQLCEPKNDWINSENEYWLTECPLHKHPFVCIRYGGNPYDAGYLISPIQLPHVSAKRSWQETA